MSVFGRWFTGSPKEEEGAAAAGGGAPLDRAASAEAPSSSAPSSSAPSSSLQQRNSSSAPAVKSGDDAHGGVKPVEVEHGYDSPEPDLYRTFSPSEVAFWDLKAPADGSGSGFFAKLFGSGSSASGKQQ